MALTPERDVEKVFLVDGEIMLSYFTGRLSS